MSENEHSNTKKKSGGLFGWFKKDRKPENQPANDSPDDSVEPSSHSETDQAVDTTEIKQANETSLHDTQADDLSSDELTKQPATAEPDVITDDLDAAQAQPETQSKPGFFSRLKSSLSKTRSNFSDGLGSLVLGKKVIDDDLLEDIETQLLMADVGYDATAVIIKDLTERSARKQLKDPDALMARLRELLAEMVEPVAQPLTIDTSTHQPFVILMVGVNGVGKTTTIGKLAKQLKGQGLSVMLAAGDTFRAAAVEQLQVWGQRNSIPVVAQHEGADSASVIYDALQSAQSKSVDVLIADTAGRLHTKDNLMEELTKVKRVMAKLDGSAPHEVMLVVDAGTGQNALNQAEQFHKAVGLSGITLTKLDGTAKGGVVFALAKKMNIAIRFIGVGESLEDLRPFDANEFIDALFDQ